MTTYDELEAFASAALFHTDPTEAHSASSQTDVDCAFATTANNVRTTTAGTIVRWKTETKAFMAFPLCVTVQNTRQMAQRLFVALWIKRSKVRDLIRCANYMYTFGCQASGARLCGPKFARGGVKIVRCALDQCSKVRDLIRCANYIHIF